MSPQISGMIAAPKFWLVSPVGKSSPRDRETWTTRTEEKPCIWLEIPLLFWDLLLLKETVPFVPCTQNKSFMIIPTFQERPPRSWFANPSNYTHRPRGLPGLQHGGFPVVEHEKRNCRKYAYTQCFLHSDSEFSGF